MKRRVTRLAPNLCPACGYLLDAATPAHDRRETPKPGMLTICLQCQAILRFDKTLKPCPVSRQQLERMDAQDPGLLMELERLRQIARRVMADAPPPDPLIRH